MGDNFFGGVVLANHQPEAGVAISQQIGGHLPEISPQLRALSHCCPEFAHSQQGHQVFVIQMQENLGNVYQYIAQHLPHVPVQEFRQTVRNSLLVA